jgi:hypothetical protein
MVLRVGDPVLEEWKARMKVDLFFTNKHRIEESHNTRSAPMFGKSVLANK